MINQIQQIDDWQNKTAAQIETELAAMVIYHNAKLWRTADLMAALGIAETRQVLATIKTGSASDPLLEQAYTALSTNGFSLDDDIRQAIIDDLATAGSWSTELKASVKALGRPLRTKWESLGGVGAVPSAAAIQAAINKYNLETEWATQQNDGGINAALAGGDRAGMVVALRAAADAIEGV